MARRPSTPRPTPRRRASTPPRRPAPASRRTVPSSSSRTVPAPTPAASTSAAAPVTPTSPTSPTQPTQPTQPTSPASPSTPAQPPRPERPQPSTARATRTRSASVGRPGPAPSPATRTASPGENSPEEGSGRIVQAAGRFRELVSGRPWRRRRRAIIATTMAVVLLLVAGFLTAIFLPSLQLQQVTVAGLGYVEEDQVRDSVEQYRGDSVLLLPDSEIAEAVGAVPGVHSVDVERDWPDGVRVTVTEETPVALLTKTDGTTAVLDAQGQELPAAAGEGASLVPLAVDDGSADPEGAATAMSEVLASVPDSLRGSVQEVTASSASDVRLVLALEDDGTKSVVWGDAEDAELKAKVVQALVGEPGTEIDVSSPVAPVTR